MIICRISAAYRRTKRVIAHTVIARLFGDSKASNAETGGFEDRMPAFPRTSWSTFVCFSAPSWFWGNRALSVGPRCTAARVCSPSRQGWQPKSVRCLRVLREVMHRYNGCVGHASIPSRLFSPPQDNMTLIAVDLRGFLESSSPDSDSAMS